MTQAGGIRDDLSEYLAAIGIVAAALLLGVLLGLGAGWWWWAH
jgi:hypothetical protein